MLSMHFAFAWKRFKSFFGRLWDFILGPSWGYVRPGSPAKRVTKKHLKKGALKKRARWSG
eukprot:11753352-Karenia_brevis.AAC.1